MLNFWMHRAREEATKSTCLRRQAGSVLVRDRKYISAGSNKTPGALPGCNELGICSQEQNNAQRGNLQFCRTMHSEVECIKNATKQISNFAGTTMYCTDSPCRYCAFIIIGFGVEKVVYDKIYPDGGVEILKEAGLIVEKWCD